MSIETGRCLLRIVSSTRGVEFSDLLTESYLIRNLWEGGCENQTWIELAQDHFR
jgi:hypothetical protein